MKLLLLQLCLIALLVGYNKASNSNIIDVLQMRTTGTSPHRNALNANTTYNFISKHPTKVVSDVEAFAKLFKNDDPPTNATSPSAIKTKRYLRSSKEINTQRHFWIPYYSKQDLLNKETAVVIIDMWNEHWCLTYKNWVSKIGPTMNKYIKFFRDNNVHIVHTPSDCLPFYKYHLARLHTLEVTGVIPETGMTPEEFNLQNYYINTMFGGSRDFCPTEKENVGFLPDGWTRQTKDIEIEPKDFILNGNNQYEAKELFTKLGVKNLIYVGIASDICVLIRQAGMIQMTKFDFNLFFVDELVTATYDPFSFPHLGKKETDIFVNGALEKFIASSISIDDLNVE